MLLKDPEVQPVFRMYIENILATSELKILKRLADVETALGLNDFADEEEMSIPEQISLLSERIDNISEGSAVPPVESNVPTSKTELRAFELVEKLKKTPERNHAVFLTSREIMDFLKDDLPEEYRVNSKVKNPRQIKKDVIEKAVELYPDLVFTSKKRTGNKEVRLVYNQKINSNSPKCKLSVS